MKPPKRIPRISAKKLKALGGKMPFSSVAPSSKPKPLPRSAPKQKARKPVPKANPERQKKAAKRGAAKHKAYMASETRKVVDARADGRCEFTAPWGGAMPCGKYTETAWKSDIMRCDATEDLQHHHKTYSRYGGNELPTDILKVCKPHHDYLESLKPAGNRRSRRIA